MTPSIELRNMAAELHETLEKAQDAYRDWEDSNVCRLNTQADYDLADAEEGYEAFCLDHGFRLKTDASGLFLRCAETGIPLVIGDEYDELETGECVLVKRAA